MKTFFTLFTIICAMLFIEANATAQNSSPNGKPFIEANAAIPGCTPDVTPPVIVAIPTIPISINTLGRESTYSNVQLNGGTNYLSVDPSTTVTLTANWTSSYAGGGGCPSCVTQHYVGIQGIFWDCHGAPTSIYSGNTSGTINHSFTAPSASGVYYITQNGSWCYNCGDCVPGFNNDFYSAIAVLIVKGPGTNFCLNDINVPATLGLCSAVVSYPLIKAFDNCDANPIISQTTGLSSGSSFPTGTTINTFQATDATGNTSTCSFSVIVTDNQGPTIACPGNLTVNTSANEIACGTNVCYASPIASDNCPPATPQGFNYLGNYGNSYYYLSSALYYFHDADNLARADGGHLAYINSATENAAVTTMMGGIGFSWIGGTDTLQEGSWVWEDCTPATYTNFSPGEPNGTTYENHLEFREDGKWNDLLYNTVRYALVEIEGAKIVQTAGLKQGDFFPVGTTTNTFVVSDANGNTSSCSFDVTVNDATPPILASKPSIPKSISTLGRESTYSNVKLNNGPNLIKVAPNTPITLTANWTSSYTDGGGCPTCVTQHYVGIQGIFWDCHGAPTSIYSSNTSGTINQTFNAPTAPGVYYITQNGSWCYNCGDCVPTFPNSPANAIAVVIVDGGGPIPCRADITVNNETGICGAHVSYDPIVGFDNCSGDLAVVQTTGLPSGSLFPVGTTINTFLATDNNGNTATCSFSVIVNDTELPSITCPQTLTVSCASLVPAPDPSSVSKSDNCGTPTVSFVNDVISGQICANKYTITRTYKATDTAGNSSSCTQLITVNDITPPSISCPSTITVSCSSAVPTPNISLVSASDNCSGTVTISFVSDIISGQICANKYTIARTYRATDLCGNSATCAQIITVNDITPPSIICPGPLTISCGSELPEPNPSLVSATDNCSGALTIVFVSDVISGQSCLNKYTVIRTYRASDVCGNSATCTQIITVNDNVPPTITCPGPMNFTCASQIPAPNISQVISSDNCEGPVVITFVSDVISNQSCPNKYIVTRTYKSTDNCGNTATCTQIFTVKDDVSPQLFAVPANVTIECSDPIPGLPNVSATDNCTGTVNITFTEVSTKSNYASYCGSISYIITRKWLATDACGNTSSKSQTITVQDTKAPSFTSTPPQFITVECDEDNNNNVNPLIVDDCDAQPSLLLDIKYKPYANECVNSYVAIYTWTAGDKCGNTSQFTQYITVVDTEAPIIKCPENITMISLVPIVVKWPQAKASDYCEGQIQTVQIQGPPSGSIFMPGSKTLIVYSATDGCGNVSTCSFIVAIINGGTSIEPIVTKISDAQKTITDPDLVNFSATLSENAGTADAMIKWEIKNADNMKDFVVEKAKIGSPFKDAIIVDNTIDKKQLDFNTLDKNIQEGIWNYRLRIEKSDGSHTYSALKAISYKIDDQLHLYPNPASDEIVFSLKDYLNRQASIQIFNVNGQNVFEKNMGEIKDPNFNLSIKNIDAGLYWVRVQIDTDKTLTSKLIILH